MVKAYIDAPICKLKTFHTNSPVSVQSERAVAPRDKASVLSDSDNYMDQIREETQLIKKLRSELRQNFPNLIRANNGRKN